MIERLSSLSENLSDSSNQTSLILKSPPINTNDLKYEVLKENNPHFDLSFKIIIVGNSGVGKSCLSLKATKNIFDVNYNETIGFEFFDFNVCFEDKERIKLQIWDTCGQEIYRSFISNFYRNSSLAIIVYSISDKNSFDDVEEWLKELKAKSSPDIKIFLLGNKADLEEERQVTYEEGEQLKNFYDILYFKETSAKTGLNVTEVFVEAAKLLYKDYFKYKTMKRVILPKNHNKFSNIKLDKRIIIEKKNNDKQKRDTCC